MGIEAINYPILYLYYHEQLLMVPLLHNQHHPMRKQQEQRMVRERDNNIMIAYGIVCACI